MTRSNCFSRQIGCLFGIFSILLVTFLFAGKFEDFRQIRGTISSRFSGEILQPTNPQDTIEKVVASVVKLCRIGPHTSCLPPYVPRTPTFLTSKQNHFSVCKIEKVMSTFLTATTCYLVKKERFLRANRSIHTELWSKRLCGKSIEYNGFPLKNDSDQRRDQTTLPKDWNFLAVVREPISRFISGYINKCIIERQSRTKYAKNCYSCAGNMTCFVGKLYKNAKMFVQAKGKKYLSYEGKHFFPQTWYCAFNQFPYSIVHYGDSALARINMTQQIIAFLKKARVQQIDLEYIEKELNFKSPHGLKNESLKFQQSVERELWSNQYVVRKLIEIFYFDFVLLGFPVPYHSHK